MAKKDTMPGILGAVFGLGLVILTGGFGLVLTAGALQMMALGGMVVGYGLGMGLSSLLDFDTALPATGTYCRTGDIVPIAYGKVMIGGNVIRGNDPAVAGAMDKIAIIYGHCQGPIAGYLNTYINEIEWGSLPSDHGKTKVQAIGDRTQTVDTSIFTVNDQAFRGLAYTIVAFDSDDETGTGIEPTIKVLIEGKKCATIGTPGTLTYSRSPARVMYDILIREGWLSTDIDSDSFNALDTYCNAIPSGGTIQRYRFDYVFNAAISLSDMKRLVWSSFNGCVIFSQGLLKAVWEQPSASVFDFTIDNIIKDSLSFLPMRRYNIVRVLYIESVNNKYTQEAVEERDEIDIRNNGERLLELNCPYITDAEIARRRCRFFYYKSMYTDGSCKLIGFPVSLKLEPFDVVQVTYALFGWTSKKFMIKEKTESLEGYPAFAMDAYNADIYVETESPAMSEEGVIYPSEYDIAPQVTNLEVVQVGATALILITYDKPASLVWSGAVIFLKISTETNYRYIMEDPAKGAGCYIAGNQGGFAIGDTVNVRVAALNRRQLRNDTSAVDHSVILS